MKKLMTIAMLALTVGAFAQSGNKVNNQEGKKQSTEIRAKKDGDKKEGCKKDGKKGDKKRGDKKKGGDKFADLNLTEAQKTQLKALKGERKSKGELAQNTKPSKEEMQAKRAERDAKIKTILTPEQYAKFTAKKEMKSKDKKQVKS